MCLNSGPRRDGIAQDRLDSELAEGMQSRVTDHVLSLVSTALDDFESASVGATIRRALRIARLLGDGPDAYRFSLDLGLVTPDSTPPDPWGPAVLQSWLHDHQGADPTSRSEGGDPNRTVIWDVPVDQLTIPEFPFEERLSWHTKFERANRKIQADSVLTVIKNRAFEYLIGRETVLRFSSAGEDIFRRHQARVDKLLLEVAPEILDKVTAAVRRAGESEDREPRAQALTSCRRILVALADLVYPARQGQYVDAAGVAYQVGENNYRNRIVAGLDQYLRSTAGASLLASLDDVANRVQKLDALSQKGVHAEVSEREMDFCVVQTYLIAGEVLDVYRADR